MKTGPPKLFRRWRGDIGGSEELETLPRQGPQWVGEGTFAGSGGNDGVA